MDERMKVSVLIPTRSNVGHLRNCLLSLIDAEKNADCDIEVLVLDGENKSQLKDVLTPRAGLADLAWCPVEQWWNYSRINNYGVKHATGDYLLLLNDDCYVGPTFFADFMSRVHVTELEVGKPAIHAPMLLTSTERVQSCGFVVKQGGGPLPIAFNTPIEWFNPARSFRPATVSFSCALMRKSLYEELGGLNPDYYFGLEDTDFCLRAWGAGHPSIVHTTVHCMHDGAASNEVKNQYFPRANPVHNFTIFSKNWTPETLKPVYEQMDAIGVDHA